MSGAGGTGLRFEFAPDQRHHVRGGFGEGKDYRLFVNKQCSPPEDWSSNIVSDFYLNLAPGDHIDGSFYAGMN